MPHQGSHPASLTAQWIEWFYMNGPSAKPLAVMWTVHGKTSVQVSLWVCTSQCAYGGPRTICGSWLSPSPLWIPRHIVSHRTGVTVVSHYVGAGRASALNYWVIYLQQKCDVSLQKLVPRNCRSLQRTGIFLTGLCNLHDSFYPPASRKFKLGINSHSNAIYYDWFWCFISLG